MNFSEALKELKSGKKITRKIWENLCVYRVFPEKGMPDIYDLYALQYDYIDRSIVEECKPFNTLMLSACDLLAKDWEVIEENGLRDNGEA